MRNPKEIPVQDDRFKRVVGDRAYHRTVTCVVKGHTVGYRRPGGKSMFWASEKEWFAWVADAKVAFRSDLSPDE